MQAVTLRDISEETGLSKETISHILGGKRRHLFKTETREMVLSTVKRMGYQPNSGARSMRRGNFGAVALLMPSNMGKTYFPQDLLAGIEDTLTAVDLNLIIVRVADETLELQDKIPQILRERMVDGILINYLVYVPPRLQELVTQRHYPAVWINVRQKYDAIYPDEFQAGMDLTKEMIRLGHRRIGYLDLREASHFSRFERMRGYTEAMQDAGLEPKVAESPVSWAANGVQSVKEWLLSPLRPTVLISYCIPTELLYAIQSDMHLAVPEDLSVVTFSDRPNISLGFEIGGMLLPEYEIGRAAVQMLTGKIAAQKTKMLSQALPTSFHPGDTCGHPNVDASERLKRISKREFHK